MPSEGARARKGGTMADDDDREPEQAPLPEFIEENWEVGKKEVVIEGDGIRVKVELLPRVAGARATTMEFFTRPF
jgi:hypothetical protein